MAKRQRTSDSPTHFSSLTEKLGDLTRNPEERSSRGGQVAPMWSQTIFESHNPGYHIPLSVVGFNEQFTPTGLSFMDHPTIESLQGTWGVKVGDAQRLDYFTTRPIHITTFEADDVLPIDSDFRVAAAEYFNCFFAYIEKTGEFLYRTITHSPVTINGQVEWRPSVEYIPKTKADITEMTTNLRFWYMGKKGARQSLSFLECWRHSHRRLTYKDVEYWPFSGMRVPLTKSDTHPPDSTRRKDILNLMVNAGGLLGDKIRQHMLSINKSVQQHQEEAGQMVCDAWSLLKEKSAVFKHIHSVWCGSSKPLTWHTLAFIGSGVVRPDMRVEQMLILVASQGIGKNIIWEHFIQPLYGESQCWVITNSSDLVERFNDYLVGKTMVLMDECSLNTFEKNSQMQKLKSMISNPTLVIEAKFKVGRVV